ncbi:hypothetical protein AB0K12_00645 [Nonomuraea sp. NPDC049419]
MARQRIATARKVARQQASDATEPDYGTYFREAVEDIDAFLDGAPIRHLT